MSRFLAMENSKAIPAGISSPESLFSDFVEQRYLPFAQENKRSWKDDKGNLERYVLPHLGALCLSDITTDANFFVCIGINKRDLWTILDHYKSETLALVRISSLRTM